jgi:DNA invertase Pin-like site-specific DNA recombinase
MKKTMESDAWALIRVSSLAQKDNNSFENQRQHIVRYAKESNLEITNFVEIIESASSKLERKKYDLFMQAVKKRKVKHIIFYSKDRESRNLTDYEKNEHLIRSGSVSIHYALDRKVFNKNTPDSEFLGRDMMGVLNTHYSRDLSTKVKHGTRVKAETGWSPNCKPPLGYINEKIKTAQGFEKQRGTIIVIDPNLKNTALVKREFELRAQTPTPSLVEIRKQIISEGLINPEEIKKYHVSAIEKRLKNIFYDGRFMWSGKEYVGKHARIINSSLFNKVQDSFGHRNLYGKKGEGVFRNGWLKCSKDNCGCHIIHDPRKKLIKSTGEEKIYKHYRCTNGKNAHKDTKGLRIEESELLKQFAKVVELLTISDDFATQLLVHINQNQSSQSQRFSAQLEDLKLSLPIYDKKLMELYEDYKSGLIDQTDYKNFVNIQKQNKANSLSEIEKLEGSKSNIRLETIESTLQLAKDAKTLWEKRSDADKAVLLEKLLSNQSLNGVTVEFNLKKPFQMLSEMSRNSSWRRGWDLNPRYHFW